MFLVLESEGYNVQLSRVASAALLVCKEVDRQSLSCSCNLEKYREHGMPWMGKLVERIPPKMTRQLHLSVLTFVSSVAILVTLWTKNHLKTLLEKFSPHVNQVML